ncbi:MAG: aspartate--tRNA ligase, partial [Actinobacteria bacterium]|nr:aspartate--tRNA ligase [Actinomycetota bacterium]
MNNSLEFGKNILFDRFVTTLRTNLCGQLNKEFISKKVRVCGWVNKRRDHGKLIFIDLRDFSGIVQLVFDQNYNLKTYEAARDLRSEYVISIEGTVSARSEETVNPDIKTGEIEIFADAISVLSASKTPPFILDERDRVDEMSRLKYRYIDLRTEEMQYNLRLRHRVTLTTRNYLNSNGFIEIETPILAKSTPEGARDFLVPSRLNPGNFYALPQSPQLFKQILMFSGFDRIYQIARCFRDEDLRADRQPEFTQIDLEMSFIGVEDIIKLIEGLLKDIFKNCTGETLSTPFVQFSWKSSMETYGTDKPDLRFDLKITDITEVFKNSQFNVFMNVINKKGCIKCIVVEEGAHFSRKELDDLVDMVKKYGAGGLVWMKVEKNMSLNSPVSKFLSADEKENLYKLLNLKENNLVLIVADQFLKTCESLGAIRTFIGRK